MKPAERPETPGLGAAPDAGPDPLDPGRWPFFCWCVARDGYDFTYIYGTTAECQGVVTRQVPGACVRKGGARTLDEAKGLAEAGAHALKGIYTDFGRVRAMPAREFLHDRAPPPRRPRLI